MKKALDFQKENVRKAFRLIKENPELPIIPMVHYEVVADDDALYWAGSWGDAKVDECTFDDERMYYLSDGIDELFDRFFGDKLGDNGLDPEYRKRMVEGMGWTKAIFIKIELPT